MGFLKARHLVHPDSSIIEAVGYAVLPDDQSVEVIWVETNYGKIYEYTAYEGDGRDFAAEFDKIAHGASAGKAWHAFKKNNRPNKVLDDGNPYVWGQYELTLDDPEPAKDTETAIDEQWVAEHGTQEDSKALTAIGYAPHREQAVAVALTLAEVSGNGSIDELLANADRVYEYLNR